MGPVEGLAVGQVIAVEVGGVSVAVGRPADDRFFALRNRCCHQGAPLAPGALGPFVDATDVGRPTLDPDRFVLRCPWHAYEFDVATGACVVPHAACRVRTYPVSVRDGRIIVER